MSNPRYPSLHTESLLLVKVVYDVLMVMPVRESFQMICMLADLETNIENSLKSAYNYSDEEVEKAMDNIREGNFMQYVYRSFNNQ